MRRLASQTRRVPSVYPLPRCARITLVAAVLALVTGASYGDAWGAKHWRKSGKSWGLGCVGSRYGYELLKPGYLDASLLGAVRQARAGTAPSTMVRTLNTELDLLQRCLARIQQGKGPTRKRRERDALARMEEREHYRLERMIWGEYHTDQFASDVRKQVSLLALIARARGEPEGRARWPAVAQDSVEGAFHVLRSYVAGTSYIYSEDLWRGSRLFEEILRLAEDRAKAPPELDERIDEKKRQRALQVWNSGKFDIDEGRARSWRSEMRSVLDHKSDQARRNTQRTLDRFFGLGARP